MQVQRAKITLAAPPQLTLTEQWTHISTGFASQFPLHNIHWKPVTRTSIRTIQSLRFDIISLQSVKEEGVSQIPSSLLDKPVLNIYIVFCEDSDAYRNVAKKQIKDWLNQVSQRKNQEWLLVVSTKPDARPGQSGLLKMRGSLLDRIKSDFNADKKDRCVPLAWSTDFRAPAAWAEVISKVKDGFSNAFDQAVSQREEEIKRSEMQKTMPGWNFCTFFLLKESLAISFEGVNLLEDALIQYEELEASFFQVMKDRNLWFGNFIEPSPRDDSYPLLSMTKKPYRELILANTITVFDIRVYLLARQCNLLSQMSKLADMARRSTVFLGALSSRLREFKDVLPDYFIESWVYSSSLSVVESCEERVQSQQMNPAALSALSAANGELLLSARNQLDKIGVRLAYLPNEMPFSASTVEPDPPELARIINKCSLQEITNPEILGCIRSKTTFYDLYTRTTNRAIDLFVKANRRKFALKLHGTLAALDLHRGRYSHALQTYASLPAHYTPHGWSFLESYMFSQGLEVYACMNTVCDRQWLSTALMFLKALVEGNSTGKFDDGAGKDECISDLVGKIVQASANTESTVILEESSILSLSLVIASARYAEDRDGYHLDAVVKNNLPCEFPADKIILQLCGRASETLAFEVHSQRLKPGHNPVTLFCSIPLSGSFLVEKAEIHMGCVRLQCMNNTRKKKKSPNSFIDKSTQLLINLPKDPQALQIKIDQPMEVDVSKPYRLSVALFSSRSSIAKALLTFSSSDTSFDMANGYIDHERSSDASLSFSLDGIRVTNLRKAQWAYFLIHYSNANVQDIINVKTGVEYVTTDEPDVSRKFFLTNAVTTTLALTVNVQDFFRREKLFTKFAISTSTHQHIRIRSVELYPNDNERDVVKVASQFRSQDIITVTPARPATFVFQMEVQKEVNRPLQLCVVYRVLREEVEALVFQRIKEILPESTEYGKREAVYDAVVRALEDDASWVELYEITGELLVPPNIFRNSTGYNEVLSSVVECLRESSQKVDICEWRRFVIPVDVPHIDILATVRVELDKVGSTADSSHQGDGRVITCAGQPISASVSIHTLFSWAGEDKKGISEYTIRFVVEEHIGDWLISGKKRGDFVAKNDSTHVVYLTLIALRHGELPLPTVHLTAMFDGREFATIAPPTLEAYQAHGAERILVLPRAGKTTYLLSIGCEH